MAKLKYWSFWVSDFYGSDRVSGLSGAVRRIYMELLAFEARKEGRGLPNDPGLLAKQLGLTLEEFQNAWRQPDDEEGVSQFFELDARGRLINRACEEKLAKDLKKALTNTARAEVASRARWYAPSIPPSIPPSNPSSNARMRDEGWGMRSESSPDGEEGQNGRELSSCQRQELSMDAALRKLVDAVHKVIKGKHSKCMDVVLGWREPREATWEAWQEHFRKVGSERGRVDIHSGYEHPDVMAEDVPAPSWQEREKEAFMRKSMELLKKGTR